MIDINKIRAQIDSDDIVDHIDLHANIKPFLSELLDRLEAAEQTVQDCLRIDREKAQIAQRLEAAEKERDNANAAAAGVALHAGTMQARLEMVEKKRDALRAEVEELHALIAAVKKQTDAEFCLRLKKEEEYTRLQAKIAEMEKQEPVAIVDYKRGSCIRWVEYLGWQKIKDGTKLYALPGAQGEEK